MFLQSLENLSLELFVLLTKEADWCLKFSILVFFSQKSNVTIISTDDHATRRKIPNSQKERKINPVQYF